MAQRDQDEGVRQLFKELVGDAALGDVFMHTFVSLMAVTSFSWQGLHQTYLAKNVLNMFRQINSYKPVIYTKAWDGVEDNVVIAQFLETYPEANTLQLYAKPQQAYSHVLERSQLDTTYK